jgi:glycosyltransferase involved in cell wall biosynthesis
MKPFQIMDSKYLVSVIVPLYNCEKFLHETLNSIIFQDYSHWEAIVIDDNSTDGSYSIALNYSKLDKRIKVYKNNKNLGAALTRNIAIEKANGRFLAFIDSDDVWIKNKLSKQLDFMIKNKYVFSASNYGKMNENGIIKKYYVKSLPRLTYKNLLYNPPGNLTVMYDTHFIGKIIVDNIRKRNDYLMWLKVIKKAQYLYGLNEILGYHRIRKGSLSENKLSLLKYHWHIYRRIERFNFFKSFFILFNIVSRNLLKKIIDKVYWGD